MTKIGLLSDTHGLLDKRVFEHFEPCDEIWHAGDIGSAEVLRALREFRPTRAVFGNIDGGEVRYSLSEFYRFRVEEVNVLMTHIGGYPGKYNPWLIPWFEKSLKAKQAVNSSAEDNSFNRDDIDLFVCGHSHILKVQYDKHYQFLTLNPGAAGKSGWQTVQTLLRFTIDGQKIDNLEVIELERH
ncbi:MAG: metallophosphoesterase family protein [Paludibacteraceae bacterium]|jgi:putative phosphoesterase|nr:metallophosphoesterase family protein [Paludibacteraceae bacterium]